MAMPIGLVGGLAIAPEAVAYGTEGASYVWQHGISSTLGLRRGELVVPGRVQAGCYTEKEYGPSWVDGEISGDWTFEGDVILTVLQMLGHNTAGTVVIDGSVIDTVSASVEVVYGAALSYKSLGCVATGLRINGNPGESIKWTLPLLGKTWQKDATPGTVTLPAASQVSFPSSLGALSIGGTACLFRSFSLAVDMPYVGSGRAAYAASTIKQPVRSGPCKVSGSIEVELDDTTGENTIAHLDSFIAGTALGAITFGTTKLQIADARMTGETPAWRPGMQSFPIAFDAESLTVVTS